jgi:hypothetical protein
MKVDTLFDKLVESAQNKDLEMCVFTISRILANSRITYKDSTYISDQPSLPIIQA